MARVHHDVRSIMLRGALPLAGAVFALMLGAGVWFDAQYRKIMEHGAMQTAAVLAEDAALMLTPNVLADDYDGIAQSLYAVMDDAPCTDILLVDGSGQQLVRLSRELPGIGAVHESVHGRYVPPADEGVWLIAPGRLQAWSRIEGVADLGWVRVEMPLLAHGAELEHLHRSGIAVAVLGGIALLSLLMFSMTRTYGVMRQREDDFIATERRLRDAVCHDRLTGLLNRVGLHDRLERALADRRGSDNLLAVCFLDLDGFKAVNDVHGHDRGDVLLIEVARRLQACVRDSDTVARLAGDEFVVLLEGEPRPGELHALLDRLVECVAQPVSIDGVRLRVGVSIGVTVRQRGSDADNVATLLREADEAMYAAKRGGRNRWSLHDSVGGPLFGSPWLAPVAF